MLEKINEINGRLKSILNDLSNEKDELSSALEVVQQRIDSKIDEAKGYKTNVDEYKAHIAGLEEEIASFEKDLNDLKENYGNKGLDAIVEVGTKEINAKIVSKQKEIAWNDKLKNLQDNEKYYKTELDKIKSSSKINEDLVKEATRKLDIVTKELDKSKEINLELNIALNKEKNRANELNEQLNKNIIAKAIDDSEKEIIKYKDTYNENKKKIDCIQNTFLDGIKDYVGDSLFHTIQHEYDVFMIQKKYPLLGEKFSAGIMIYKELINKTTDFLNKKDASLFRSSIQSYNYKGNLVNLVQKIFKSVTSYSGKSEFKISCFIDCYLNNKTFLDKNVYQEYVKLVNRLKNKNKKISTELLQDMRVLYAVTTTCNHDENHGEKLFAKYYQDIVNEFINNPSKKYYKIFGSFFEFIGLFIDDDSIMLPIK